MLGDARDDVAAVTQALQEHSACKVEVHEARHRAKHKDGTWFWIHDRGKVVSRSTDGKPLRMVGTHLDVTGQVLAEQELIAPKQMLEQTAQIAKVGGWEFDVDTQSVRWSDEVYAIHELGKSVVPRID